MAGARQLQGKRATLSWARVASQDAHRSSRASSPTTQDSVFKLPSPSSLLLSITELVYCKFACCLTTRSRDTTLSLTDDANNI